jgi:hypothetical protein
MTDFAIVPIYLEVLEHFKKLHVCVDEIKRNMHTKSKHVFL